MSTVFFSYSRQDRQFVSALHDAFLVHSSQVWLDMEDIPELDDWLASIKKAIDEADYFLFIVSPYSVESKVCQQEIEYALESHKSIIPLVYRKADIERVPEALKRFNVAIFNEDLSFEQNIAKLFDLMAYDQFYIEMHTRFLGRARIWEQRGKLKSYLLQGQELREALHWLASSADKQPTPAPLHVEYIEASRSVSTLQQSLDRAVRTWLPWLPGPRRKIFISYRRMDAADVSGRIYDRLAAAFGAKNIFFDALAIPAGADFSQVIRQAFAECFAVLIVISPHWLGILREREQKPDEPDYVRIEVENALRFDLVVPLLVTGAKMPSSKELPPELQRLALRNGREIRAGRDFHQDMSSLIKELKRLKAQQK